LAAFCCSASDAPHILSQSVARCSVLGTVREQSPRVREAAENRVVVYVGHPKIVIFCPYIGLFGQLVVLREET
jgi:hypothetical protein